MSGLLLAFQEPPTRADVPACFDPNVGERSGNESRSASDFPYFLILRTAYSVGVEPPNGRISTV
jgi:hypothetical protein